MWICCKCGKTAEHLNEYYDSIPYGERNVPYKVYDYQCFCGGEYIEAERCQECGEWMMPDAIQDGLCPECFDKKYTPEFALANDAHEFLYYVFGDEADRILAKELRKKPREEIERAAREFFREVL